jgi:hypothetical protein
MIRIFTTITKVIFPLLVLVSLTSFLQAQAPAITCPGNTVTYGDQSNNEAQFWNAMSYWDSIISTHDLAENAVPLAINITDTCTTGTLKVKYILYLDLENNGSQETRVDSDTLPAANTIHYNNKNSAVTGGSQWQFDFRPVALANKFRFDLLVDAVSSTEKKAQLVWRYSPTATTLAQLPYGTHKIKWVVTNGCGQQSTCEYTFIIRDEKPPVVMCINGLSVNLMNISGGTVQLYASDFLQYTEDNYTPSSKLIIGIRKQGTGTGFPSDSTGTPKTSVRYNCNELGTNLIELWSKDKAGNVSACSTYVLIQDNGNVCTGNVNYSGKITTELSEGIEDVQIHLENGSSGVPIIGGPIPPLTNADGNYTLPNALPFSSTTRIAPLLDLDPLNGVNTWDLILISRHILGLEPLTTPYKLISADANKSGTVTTFDIVEIRKLIIGSYQKFPSNHSWRFVDSSQVFSNPLNPFADVIRETINIGNLPFGIAYNFIGAKIGDVDFTAQPHGFSTPTEDRTEKTTFTFQDQNLQENEVVSLHFAPESTIEGYQMTLDFSQFELLEIIPQNDLTMDNFGVFEQALTMVTEQPNQGFNLRLRAKQAGQLSSMLAMNDKITRSVAFDAGGFSKGIVLHFNPIQKEAIQLNQNVPNPWHSATNIGFYLPEANTPVTFTVVDEMARVVYTTTNTYPSGYQSITLDESIVPQAGIYWYALTTAQDKLVQKMVKF